MFSGMADIAFSIGKKHDCLRGEESSGGSGHLRQWKLWGHYKELLHFSRRCDAQPAVFWTRFSSKAAAVVISTQLPLLLLLLFPDLDNISNLVDFIICLGGDGTLLYASSLFQVCVCVFFFLLESQNLQVNQCILCSSVGECSSSHGLSPGLAGLSDAFQIRNLPVSGHPGHRRYPTGYPRPVCEVRCTSRGLS